MIPGIQVGQTQGFGCSCQRTRRVPHLGGGQDWSGLVAKALVPTPEEYGGRGELPISATRMKDKVANHLRAAGVPSHYIIMHSFRVGGYWTQV